VSHIIMEDHCFVLVNGGEERPFTTVVHWYQEAVFALWGYLHPKVAEAPAPKEDHLDTVIRDPDLYHKLAVPFETEEAATAALKAFHLDLRRIRAKHHIADLIAAWRINIRGGPAGSAGASMGKANMGDAEHSLGMAAWLFGHEQAEHKRDIARLAAGR